MYDILLVYVLILLVIKQIMILQTQIHCMLLLCHTITVTIDNKKLNENIKTTQTMLQIFVYFKSIKHISTYNEYELTNTYIGT